MESAFLKSFCVAGFTYYQGPFVLKQMSVGDKIDLYVEAENIHDEYAVALYFKDRKIGFIPREDNREVAVILKSGYDIFEAIVQQVAPEEHPESQVRVALYVRPQNPVAEK